MEGWDRLKRVVVTFGVGSTVCGNGVYTGGSNMVFLELPTFSSGLGASTCNVYIQGAYGSQPSGAVGLVKLIIPDFNLP